MDWFVGAMTDWTPRDLDVDLSFLSGGHWNMVAFADGPDADRVASSYKRTSDEVGKTTKLKIKLAPGGGWVARLTAAAPAPVTPDAGVGAKPAKP